MPGSQSTQHDTRLRVLESAVEVFAARGFRHATIHEICKGAGANIAAVNYYFGSKEKLYAEAWRKAFSDNLAVHPPDGGVPADAPAEERLRGRVRALIHSFADEGNQAFLIMSKEMASPTALLREVHRECMTPLHEETDALMRELLGAGATEQQVRFCEASLLSLCVGVIRHARMHREHAGKEAPPMMIRDFSAYAEHAAEFALAGIRAIRAQAEGVHADG